MKLTDAPTDTILHVLQMLPVWDILAVEQVCKTLQSIVSTRHLWLVKLQLLDQPCAPRIPPYVDVERLSCSELRSTVINAVRWNRACKNGLVTSPETLLSSVQLDIKMQDVFTEFNDPSVQLVPGGKHLVINNDGLAVISVKTGRCVCQWKHRAKIPERSQRFSLETLSRNSFLMLHVFSNLATGTVILDLYQIDHHSDEYVQVRKIATSESESKPKSLVAIFLTALGNGFGVTAVSWNLVCSLLVWNWHSGQIIELVMPRNARLQNMQITDGHLFYILKCYKHLRQYCIETFALHQFDVYGSSVVDMDTLVKSSIDLHPPDGFSGISEVFNFSLYNPTGVSLPHTIRACVLAIVDCEESNGAFKLPYITAYCFAVNMGDDETHSTSGPQLHLIHQSMLKVPDGNKFLEAPLWVEAIARQSGQAVIRVGVWEWFSGSFSSYLESPIEDATHLEHRFSLVGLDEQNEIFCSLLSFDLYPSRLFLDEHNGGLVRMVLINGTVRIDAHYTH